MARHWSCSREQKSTSHHKLWIGKQGHCLKNRGVLSKHDINFACWMLRLPATVGKGVVLCGRRRADFPRTFNLSLACSCQNCSAEINRDTLKCLFDQQCSQPGIDKIHKRVLRRQWRAIFITGESHCKEGTFYGWQTPDWRALWWMAQGDFSFVDLRWTFLKSIANWMYGAFKMHKKFRSTL